MTIRILLLGNPNERLAVKTPLRTAFAARRDVRIEFDEHLRVSNAVTAFDVGETPSFVVATPIVTAEAASDLFRHVRDCNCAKPLLLWRYRTPDHETRSMFRAQNAMVITSDNPSAVTEWIMSAIDAAARS
ncbi:hypothetical protein EBS80_03150 [bacterium]|nr:hypothetical protein [bacterium]